MSVEDMNIKLLGCMLDVCQLCDKYGLTSIEERVHKLIYQFSNKNTPTRSVCIAAANDIGDCTIHSDELPICVESGLIEVFDSIVGLVYLL